MFNFNFSSPGASPIRRLFLYSLTLLFLVNGTSRAQAPCTTAPLFAGPAVDVTAFTAPGTCSPAVPLIVAMLDSLGVTFNYTLTGATAATGLGTGTGVHFNKGFTHVIISATNACGTTSRAFNVKVVDNIAPTLTHVNITVPKAAGLCGAFVPYAAPTVTDNCPGCGVLALTSAGYTFLGQFQGHFYFLTPTTGPDNFDAIDGVAAILGAHLVSINSYSEDSFIAATVPDNIPAWIGYTDRDQEGTFKWTDGSPTTYTNWCNSQPDNFAGNQNWALINSGGTSGPTGCWDDGHSPINPVINQPNNFVGVVELDACGTALVKTAGLNSNDFFPLGTSNVTYQATDASGNVNTITFTVTVTGSCAPCNITVTPSNNTFTGGVPTNIYLGYGPQTATLTASATCTGTKTYLWTGPTSLLSCTTCQSPLFTPTAAGNYTFNSRVICGTDTFRCSVTFCVKDVHGNALSCGNGNNSSKIIICHIPPGNPDNAHTNCIAPSAVPAHLGHGDNLGDCSDLCGNTARKVRSQNVIGNEVKVYPNPTTNTFTLEIPYFETSATVTLTDIQGRILQSRSFTGSDNHNVRFDLGTNSPRGIYLIDVKYDDQRYRTKIVLE